MLRFNGGRCIVLVLGELIRCPFRPALGRRKPDMAGPGSARGLSLTGQTGRNSRTCLQCLVEDLPIAVFMTSPRSQTFKVPGALARDGSAGPISTTCRRRDWLSPRWVGRVWYAARRQSRRWCFSPTYVRPRGPQDSRLASPDPSVRSRRAPRLMFSHSRIPALAVSLMIRLVVSSLSNRTSCVPNPSPRPCRPCRPLREGSESSRQPQGKRKSHAG